MFVDGHKRPDVIEDRAKFLKSMKELEQYLVEFEEEGTIKAKICPEDRQIGGDNCWSVMCITHDECTFSA